MESKGKAGDLNEERYKEPKNRRGPAFTEHFADIQAACVAAFDMEDIWHEAQELGIPWSPIRLPEENPDDIQWQTRATFFSGRTPRVGRVLHLYGRAHATQRLRLAAGPAGTAYRRTQPDSFCEQLGLSAEELADLQDKGIV